MATQDEENHLIINNGDTTEKTSARKKLPLTNLVSRGVCFSASWFFGLMGVIGLLALFIYPLVTTFSCHQGEDFPTIYDNKEEITIYNSSGHYVNITLCQTNSSEGKQCANYVCKLQDYPSNPTYPTVATNPSGNSCTSYYDRRPGDKVKVYYMDNMVIKNQVAACPFKCRYCSEYYIKKCWVILVGISTLSILFFIISLTTCTVGYAMETNL